MARPGLAPGSRPAYAHGYLLAPLRRYPSTAPPEGHHPGARASRPHSSSCKLPPIHGTPLQSAPKPPLRGFLPLCQALCGRDARAPRWSLLLPRSRPMANPSRTSPNAFVALRRPSCSFVDHSFPKYLAREAKCWRRIRGLLEPRVAAGESPLRSFAPRCRRRLGPDP